MLIRLKPSIRTVEAGFSFSPPAGSLGSEVVYGRFQETSCRQGQTQPRKSARDISFATEAGRHQRSLMIDLGLIIA
ncbi:MAG TPA: hypothetical protein VN325_35310, partial [Steroidobacteraceae bacterium]|nr:hypothetical protein [Steroidobacteraceae bacterium]